MLTASKQAVQLLTDIRDKTEATDDAVLRVGTAGPPADGTGPSISLGFVNEPFADDEVGEAHGFGICVAPEIAPQLSDAMLDVVQEEGETKLVFVQPPATP